MGDIPQFQFLDREKSAVMQIARTKGFSWCYQYPRSSAHAILAAVMLGLLLHEKVLRGSAVWQALQSNWQYAAQIFQLSALEDWSELFRNADFWRGLELAGVQLAEEVCNRSDKSHLLLSLQRGFNEDTHGALLQKLCEDLALEVHVLKLDVEGNAISTRYNDSNRRIRCYVVLAVEEGRVFYLGHERFKESRVEKKMMEFPFVTDSVGVPPYLEFHKSETPDMLISRLVEFIKSARHRYAGLEDEYASCQEAMETYSRTTGNRDLQLPELPEIKKGPHDMGNCGEYNAEEEYVLLECRHRYHKKCIEEYLLAADSREGGQVPVCPLCEVPLSAVLLSAISSRKQPCLERGEGLDLKKCEHCQLQRLSKHVFSHYTDKHYVCVCCLKSLQCPCCGVTLNATESSKIQSMLL